VFILVKYELKPETSENEFLAWSQEEDLSATRAIPGVTYFTAGRASGTNRSFAEFIGVDRRVIPSVEAWNKHVAEHMPKEGQAKFAEFVDLNSLQLVAYEENSEAKI
jgi:hypothetical protein